MKLLQLRLMKLIPTKKQWKNWSLPSKLTTIGALAGILSLMTSLFPQSNIKDNNVFDIQIDTQSVEYSNLREVEPDRMNRMTPVYDFEFKSYDIEFPKIVFESNTIVERKINKLIYNEFKNWGVDLNNIIESNRPGEFNTEYTIVYRYRNLLGIRFFIYWNTIGAAHPNHALKTFNINLENGEIFEYKDIFRSWETENINSLLIKKLKNHECDCIDEDLEFDDEGNRNFYFENKKIIVVFGKYEVACGVCGPIEVALDFKEIRDFVNPNGPLMYLLSI